MLTNYERKILELCVERGPGRIHLGGNGQVAVVNAAWRLVKKGYLRGGGKSSFYVTDLGKEEVEKNAQP